MAALRILRRVSGLAKRRNQCPDQFMPKWPVRQRERENTRRDTCREGLKLAAVEVELHEAVELPEPFGE